LLLDSIPKFIAARLFKHHIVWVYQVVTIVHMLLETSADMTYKETRTAFGNIAIGDYDLITDRTAATTSVAKWIGNDCEYDLVYK